MRQSDNESASTAAQLGAVRLLVRRATGHSALYVVTGASTLLIGLVSVAVLTRFLSPAEFGDLAVLLVTASILTLLYNLVTLQGTFAWAFGALADDDVPEEVASRPGATDRRRALGTGFLLTLGVAAAGSGVIALESDSLADWLLDDARRGGLIIWASLSAAGTALWRLAANSIRLERRPGRFLVAAVSLHLLQLVAMVAFVAAGGGIEGAVTGLAIGSFAGLAIAIVLVRRSVRLAASTADVAGILSRGRALVPVVLAFNVIQLGDLVLLSRYAPAFDVGLYRVASRAGAVLAYWTSAFHMAWGPMRRDPLHLAAERERSAEHVGAITATYFIVSTTWMLLALTILADEVVRVAPESYSKAAGLIPLIAGGFALHGLYVLLYRTQRFAGKRTWFIGLAQLGAAVFVVAALALIPPFHAYGAAVAVICAWLLPITVLWVRGHWSDARVSYDYGAAARSVVVAIALGVPLMMFRPSSAAIELALDLAVIGVYPLILVRLGVLPGRLRATLRVGGDHAGGTRDESEAAMLHQLFARRLTEGEVAADVGVSTAEIRRRVVASLRRSSGIGSPGPLDDRIGAWLLDRGAFADRDHLAQELMEEGVEPLELDRLAVALRAQKRIWRRSQGCRGAVDNEPVHD